MITINEEQLKDSIKTHGRIIKEVVCIEEMTELSKEICKDIRSELKRESLVEEYVDVLICMQMLKNIHNITDEEVQDIIDFKMKRQLKRDAETKKFFKDWKENI
jgi:hypothetical protein